MWLEILGRVPLLQKDQELHNGAWQPSFIAMGNRTRDLVQCCLVSQISSHLNPIYKKAW
jgi:hypothetical protein